MINYIYNQMLYLQEWGFYLDGVWLWRVSGGYLEVVWLWRISGVNQTSKNHSPSTLKNH